MDMAAVVQQIKERFPDAIVDVQPGWITLKREALLPVFKFLKQGLFANASLHSVTAVDRRESVEVVYHLHSFEHRLMLTAKVALANADLSVSSLVPLWDSANWLEREVFDLFGVRFIDHPDLRRILNPEEWADHPLRKDFKRADFVPRPVK